MWRWVLGWRWHMPPDASVSERVNEEGQEEPGGLALGERHLCTPGSGEDSSP